MAGAGLVLDDDGLAPALLDLIADDPCKKSMLVPAVVGTTMVSGAVRKFLRGGPLLASLRPKAAASGHGARTNSEFHVVFL